MRTSHIVFSPFRYCSLFHSVPDSSGESRSDVSVIAYNSDNSQSTMNLDRIPPLQPRARSFAKR